MKTNLAIGYNVGKLNFNLIATYRDYSAKGSCSLEKSISNFFLNLSAINRLSYSIEKSRYEEFKHAHLLLYVEDLQTFYEKLDLLVKPKKVMVGTRNIIVKVPKNETDITTDVSYKDLKINADYKVLTGNKYQIEIEKLRSPINGAIYSFKYCSYGINNGYFQR